MRHGKADIVSLIALSAALTLTSAAAGQENPVAGHSVDVSRSHASLQLQMSDDEVLDITLSGGEVRINGDDVGRYEPSGALERGWRAFLDSASSLGTPEVMRAARRWTVAGLSGTDETSRQAIASAMTGLRSVLREAVRDRLPAIEPPAPPEIRVPVGLPRRWPAFAGIGPTLAGVFGAFVALASIAFGMLSFAPRQLQIVSETVQHSFLRSFFAGLFAQPLLLPALVTLIIALVLTVVGILVIPVAVVAFVLAVVAAVVGGYIAAARALGESYLRRKMAHGMPVSADPTFRATVIGLIGLLMIWTPFALLGWVPGIGIALLVAAILFTWIMATVGLGATILSRAGLRGTFRRRIDPQLSGELSWSTVDEIAPSKHAGEGTRS
ncbi:MAG: hypothetical protein HY700_20095 [Gemmatimonadetes bacterium]|nr:hypothetical protein [Gemmatimonadota bacterium]